MAKKKKSKLKKFLKGAALAGAAALGASALGKRNRRNAMLNSATADDGFGFMDMRDYGPYSSKPNYTPRRDSILAKPGINRITDYYGESLKKGGRVGCGVAKKGFGRAMKKGRKK